MDFHNVKVRRVKFRSLLTNNNHNLCNLVRNFYRPATRPLERSL
jgi:hypothetical protein